MTIGQFAKFKDCTPPAVRAAVKAGMLQVEEDGGIDPDVNAGWVADISTNGGRREGGGRPKGSTKCVEPFIEDDSPTPKEAQHARRRSAVARAAKDEADARLAELRVAEATGELVQRDAADAAVERMIIQVKTRLLQIPQAVAPACMGREYGEVVHTLDEAIRDALAELSGIPWTKIKPPSAAPARGRPRKT
jgi:hypothetical protein